MDDTPAPAPWRLATTPSGYAIVDRDLVTVAHVSDQVDARLIIAAPALYAALAALPLPPGPEGDPARAALAAARPVTLPVACRTPLECSTRNYCMQSPACHDD